MYRETPRCGKYEGDHDNHKLDACGISCPIMLFDGKLCRSLCFSACNWLLTGVIVRRHDQESARSIDSPVNIDQGINERIIGQWRCITVQLGERGLCSRNGQLKLSRQSLMAASFQWITRMEATGYTT